MSVEGQSESQIPHVEGGVEEAETIAMQPVRSPADGTAAEGPVDLFRDGVGAPEPVDLFDDEAASRAFGQEAIAKRSWFGAHKAIWITLAVVFLLAVVLVGGFLGARQYFQDRVAPGVSFAGQSMMGKDAAQVRQIVSRKVKDSKVELDAPGRGPVSAGLSDLGVSVDEERTAKDLMESKRQGDFARLNPFKRVSVPLVAKDDELKMDRYLTGRLVDGGEHSVPSSIVFDEGLHAFTVQEGRGGQAPRLDPVKDAVSALVQEPGQQVRAKVSFYDVPMPISKEVASRVAGEANQRIGKDLVIQGADDDTMKVPAPVVASWVKPDTDLKRGTMSLDFDQTAVSSYLSRELPKGLDREMVTAVNVKNTKGEVVAETTKGVDGVKVKDFDATADQVIQVLKSGSMAPVKAQADVTPHKEQTRTARYDVPDGDTWIDVNLSNQTATAYHGTTPVQTFLICSGKPYDGDGSDTGTFFINVRYQVQTMRGPGYVSPDVRWVSYYNGSEGFHTADWNYDGIARGDPMHNGSHGCINMYEQDAKWIYDNAPVGTMVRVSGQVPSGAVR